jgi:hypothetical protein
VGIRLVRGLPSYSTLGRISVAHIQLGNIQSLSRYRLSQNGFNTQQTLKSTVGQVHSLRYFIAYLLFHHMTSKLPQMVLLHSLDLRIIPTKLSIVPILTPKIVYMERAKSVPTKAAIDIEVFTVCNKQ